MKVSGEYRVARDRQTVWRALNDPQLLRRCIPGCERLEQLDGECFRATVKLSIGPVGATFDTQIRITNVNEPAAYRLEGEGRAGPVGFGKGYADVVLTEEGEFTRLNYSADFQVGGRLAQLGSRLVVSATHKIVDDFFARMTADIDASARRVISPPPPRKTPRFVWVVCVLVWVLIVVTYWLLRP